VNNDQINELALAIPCPRCEAKVNEPCTSITGGKAPLHTGRTEPLLRAYGFGYADGAAGAPEPDGPPWKGDHPNRPKVPQVEP
jgi:hypothetical protein